VTKSIMNDQPRHPDSSDPALDDLLARAVWPEADESSIRRLEARWREISPAAVRRRRRTLGWLIPVAAAAAVLIVGMLVALLVLGNYKAPPGREVVATGPASQGTVRLVSLTPDYPSRELTRREALLLRLAMMSPRKSAAADDRSGAEVLVDGIVSDALWRPWAGSWPAFRPRYHCRAAEERLLERLAGGGEDIEERVGSARLLSAIASPGSLAALVTLYRDESTREAALPGVLRLADPPTLAMLARQGGVARDRPRLIATMLRRDPQKGARLLLPLIKESGTAAAALDALDSLAAADCPAAVRRGVTTALFDELQGSRVEDRLAAAQALGRIDGPEVAARLADMAERNLSRREALAALIWCGGHSEAASAALESARRSPRLSSTMRSLEMTMTVARPRAGESRS
jgi:hypothetical protein